MVGLNMDLNNIPDNLIEIRRVFVSENITEKCSFLVIIFAQDTIN